MITAALRAGLGLPAELDHCPPADRVSLAGCRCWRRLCIIIIHHHHCCY
jgi:hypothetical protein